MATFRKSIIDWRVAPDASGNCFPQLYPLVATNDFWNNLFFNFNEPAADIYLYGAFEVPGNYVGSAKLIVVWTSQTTSGNFGIEFAYRAVGGNDSESLDQATAQETVNTTDVAPGATDRRMEISVNLTSGNLAAGDTVEWRFARDDSADSIAGVVQIVDLLFEYADA
jgi:hypothetical protein